MAKNVQKPSRLGTKKGGRLYRGLRLYVQQLVPGYFLSHPVPSSILKWPPQAEHFRTFTKWPILSFYPHGIECPTFGSLQPLPGTRVFPQSPGSFLNFKMASTGCIFYPPYPSPFYNFGFGGSLFRALLIIYINLTYFFQPIHIPGGISTTY